MQHAIWLLTFLFHLIILVILTVLTQVGGFIYLCCIPIFSYIRSHYLNKITRFLLQTASFLALYLGSVILIVPVVAPFFGRVTLPVFHSDLRPHNWLTVFMCRHYVRPALLRVAEEVAVEMKRTHQSTLLYLDAQHPFFDRWPLIPHLSHSDGRKLDIALLWKDSGTNDPMYGTPSAIGYGVFEDPRPGEYDRAKECEAKGYWQYGYTEKIVPQHRKPYFKLDEERTAAMTRLFCNHPHVRRVLIEPYLKKRLKLNDLDKLRHHGCNAVRHDDHIHVELTSN